jgi:hypothetical protein
MKQTFARNPWRMGPWGGTGDALPHLTPAGVTPGIPFPALGSPGYAFARPFTERAVAGPGTSSLTAERGHHYG